MPTNDANYFLTATTVLLISITIMVFLMLTHCSDLLVNKQCSKEFHNEDSQAFGAYVVPFVPSFLGQMVCGVHQKQNQLRQSGHCESLHLCLLITYLYMGAHVSHILYTTAMDI